MIEYICVTKCRAVIVDGLKPCILKLDETWKLTKVCVPLGDMKKARWLKRGICIDCSGEGQIAYLLPPKHGIVDVSEFPRQCKTCEGTGRV